MSNIFSKLLDESEKQRQQIENLAINESTEIFPSPPQSSEEEKRRSEQPSERPSDALTNERSDGATQRPSDVSTTDQNDVSTERLNDLPTLRRSTERIAFDLYKDQVKAIRRLRAERELDGNGRISLSDIAREAFELYLKNKNSK